MTRFFPRLDGRPVVSDVFPGATAVAVTVYNVRDNEILPASSTAASKLGATDVWSYDLSFITGTIPLVGGESLEDVFEAELLAVMVPTGGTGTIVTKSLTLNGIQKLLAFDLVYGGAINVDVANGSAGAVPFVNGTLAFPVNNETDARTLADFFGRRKYKLSGSTTLAITVDHKEWAFEASAIITPVSIATGLDIDGSVFRNLSVSGDLGAASLFSVTLDRCFTSGFTFSGTVLLTETLVAGVITFAAAKFNNLGLFNCIFVDVGLGAPGIDVADSGGTVSAFGSSGEMFLRNSSTAGINHTFFLNGGKVIFESTASDGTAKVSGIGTFDNQGAIAIDSEGLIDEAGLGRHVLIDQREYEQDGAAFLQTSCRRSVFASAADLAATTPDDTPPFTPTPHALAVKTMRITSVRDPSNAGQPKSFAVDVE